MVTRQSPPRLYILYRHPYMQFPAVYTHYCINTYLTDCNVLRRHCSRVVVICSPIRVHLRLSSKDSKISPTMQELLYQCNFPKECGKVQCRPPLDTKDEPRHEIQYLCIITLLSCAFKSILSQAISACAGDVKGSSQPHCKQ